MEARHVLIPEGVTITASDTLLIKAESIEVFGAIIGSDGTRQASGNGVSIAILAKEDLTIQGIVRAGSGRHASTTQVDYGVDVSKLPLAYSEGQSGGHGGSLYFGFGAKALLWLAEEGLVAAGDGGDGSAVTAEGWQESVGQRPFSAQAFAGHGGHGGSLVLDGGFCDLSGRIKIGCGGQGGNAYALGGRGSADFFNGQHYLLATKGGYGAAIAGHGGESGNFELKNNKRCNPIEFEGGIGGSGGLAHAEAGATGDRTVDFQSLHSVTIVHPAELDSSSPVVSLRSFDLGSSFSIGGNGGSGYPGGTGGSAISGDGADGVDSPDGPGSNGSSSESHAGHGGSGKCGFLKAFPGERGGDAKSLNGGDGGAGGSDPFVDANPGGRGGYSWAEGGNGGNGGDCTFAKGKGGNGGGAISGKGGDGGNGGLCSDGGEGADSIADGGSGGKGNPGGDGGGAGSNRAGVGGDGSACPCNIRGQGGDGGRGGDSLATGGDGSAGYKSRHGCGDGGEAVSSHGGNGGRAGIGTPGGLGGNGGFTNATGGNKGCDTANSGGSTSGSGGIGGASGANNPCSTPTWPHSKAPPTGFVVRPR